MRALLITRPIRFSDADPAFVAAAADALANLGLRTMSAELDDRCPFRETAEAIETARAKGILAIEMEAAASMLSRAWRTRGCFVWPMSQTRWGSWVRTLKRVKQTAHKTLSPSLRTTVAALYKS